MVIDSNTQLFVVDAKNLLRIIHEEVSAVLKEANKEVREVATGTLTRKEAADLLHISLPTLHKLVNEGQLHPIHIGGKKKVLFRKLEVESLISNNA